jgi:long-chain fatty acid transport protein
VLASVLPQATLAQLGPQPDGLFRLRGHDWAFGYNFGGLIQPAPGTNIGITYRSRLEHEFDTQASFTVPPTLAGVPAFASGESRTKLILPDNATISLTQKLTSRLTGYANFTWNDWSLLKNLAVYRTNGALIDNTVLNYKNSIFISIGASYQVNDKLTVRAGTAFDQSPVRDAYITPRVPDDNRYWLALGASYKVLPNATIDVAYVHIFAEKPSINELSITDDLLSGYFQGHIDVASIGVRFKL